MKIMKRSQQRAFTIVELLIVIVVIAILAAITIVAFNGVQDRARSSAAASSSTQAAKKVKVWQVEREGQSPNCSEFFEMVTGRPAAEAPTSTCAFDHKDTNYQYTPSSTVAGGYCVTTTVGNRSYKVSEATAPTTGGCGGHGQGGVAAITNLAVNPSVETNTTGISGYSGASGISRDTSQAYKGNASWSRTATAATGNWGVIILLEGGKPNTNYTCSTYVRSSVNMSMTFAGRAQTTGGAYIGEAYGATSITANTSWQRVEVNFTSPSNADQNVLFQGRTNGAINGTMWIDATMCTEGTTSYNYADGTSPDWIWNGANHNSSSTGPPL